MMRPSSVSRAPVPPLVSPACMQRAVAPCAVGRVNTIVAGGTQSLAITKEGRVWQWGQRTFLNPQPVDYCYLTLQEDESDGDSKGSKGALSWLGVGGRKKGSEVGHKLTAVKVRCCGDVVHTRACTRTHTAHAPCYVERRWHAVRAWPPLSTARASSLLGART